MKRIMMPEKLPWEIIEQSETGIKIIRVDEFHPQEFYWGKDANGNFLLIIKFQPHDIVDLLKMKINMHGINSDVCMDTTFGKPYFQLTLLNKENSDIFYTLCIDIIEKTRTFTNSENIVPLILNRLERWKIFLSNSNRNILSSEQITGLFGELLFLEECIDSNHMGIPAAINGWMGPSGAAQDFVFDSSAVEIKSIRNLACDKVRISNEFQLTTQLNNLHLRIQYLSVDLDCRNGISLNALVSRLLNKINDFDSIAIFESKLNEVGYIDIPDYDTPYFSSINDLTYDVNGDFPRITPESLPVGISDVSYDIHIRKITPFLCKSHLPGAHK